MEYQAQDMATNKKRTKMPCPWTSTIYHRVATPLLSLTVLAMCLPIQHIIYYFNKCIHSLVWTHTNLFGHLFIFDIQFMLCFGFYNQCCNKHPYYTYPM